VYAREEQESPYSKLKPVSRHRPPVSLATPFRRIYLLRMPHARSCSDVEDGNCSLSSLEKALWLELWPAG